MTAAPQRPLERGTAARRAGEVIEAIGAADRDEVWISRVPAADLVAAAERIDRRVDAGEALPFAGLAFAVKDNIDVGGWPTTAGCPAFARTPRRSAPSVGALVDAGALYVGKTNLDQFATGLVGTRSPYGAVRNAVAAEYVSGGSSSGSAVAVAVGLVDFALGTDTAGSGRVPAALNGVVGIKPTRGMVSTTGVVPACRSLDCVTVFAPTVSMGARALAILARFDRSDPRSRAVPPGAPQGLWPSPMVAHPDPAALDDLDPARRRCYEEALRRLEAAGCRTAIIDVGPFLEAGNLLYAGAFVAERYAAVGSWVGDHLDEVDPVVGAIIAAAGQIPASRLAEDIERLVDLSRQAEEQLDAVGANSLILPTAPFHPSIAEVGADPFGTNVRLGRYTTFANLLDMCAVAVPSGDAGGLPFGVSLLGPAWTDLVQADLARIIEGGEHPGPPERWEGDHGAYPNGAAMSVVVVGAHLDGQPLNHQITDRGGRKVASKRTAPLYRLFALATEPAKPGLARVARDGAPIEVEVWRLPPGGFADLVGSVPSPMAIGKIVLADGTEQPGFVCEPMALVDAVDITGYGGWRAYLAAKERW